MGGGRISDLVGSRRFAEASTLLRSVANRMVRFNRLEGGPTVQPAQIPPFALADRPGRMV
jgi:hypothetical protein